MDRDHSRTRGLRDDDALEQGWPCQRLRLAFGLILFFLFEMTIGRQLPRELAIIALGIGAASLVSAMRAIQEWRLNAQLTHVLRALEHQRA